MGGASHVAITLGTMPCPRILSLDGGGVRGLSSLLILREIMEEIGRGPGNPDNPLPCHYFDLMGGTSTGGLIAIMLGRLRMVFSFHAEVPDRLGRWMTVLWRIWICQKGCSKPIR